MEKREQTRNLSVLAKQMIYKNERIVLADGQRWIAKETVFSYIKRTFAEYVYSVKLKNMIQEMMLKASLYNKMIYLFRENR